jgi:TRAP-type C4-dicarboxylate transport system permease small subunit
MTTKSGDRSKMIVTLTTWVLAGTLLVIGGYDVWALIWAGEEFTVSHTILELSRAHPLVPLLVGLLLGHLFWPQEPPR